MWTILEIVINLYQSFLMIFFIKKRTADDRSISFLEVAAWFLTAVFLSLTGFGLLPVPDTLVFLFPFIYSLIASNEKWYACAVWSIVLALVFISSTSVIMDLVAGLTDASWDILMQPGKMRFLSIIGANLTITIFTVVIANWNKHPYSSSPASVVCFLVLLFVELVINETLYILQLTLQIDHSLFFFANLMVMVAMILTLILFETTNRLSGQLREKELSLQTLQLSREHQEELRTMYTGMLSTQHDLRHRISLAEGILNSGNNNSEKEKALQLLKDTDVLNEFITGNTTIDAVLTAKSTIMKQAGIRFDYSPCSLSELPIDEQSFCILLSNLLDNAIEGVMRLPASAPSRAIRLELAKSRSTFFITCKNDMDPETIKLGKSGFISSKPHSEIHGFGTRSIQQIVSKADGWCKFIPSGRHFIVQIMFPDNNPDTENNESSNPMFSE